MSVVPRTLLEKIQWAEGHVAPFNSNAVAIGTTVAEAAAFQAKTEAARDALTAAEAARNASRAASQTLKTAIAALDIAAAGICKQVRVKAETTNNPDVYALATIPAPATPAPVGPPGKPTDLVVTLSELGQINMKWKCPNPPGAQGTIYQIWRRIGDDGVPTYLGGTGKKLFTDSTLPAGTTTTVVYQIQGSRSTKNGEWATFNVKFGVGGAGAMTASVTATDGPKIAA